MGQFSDLERIFGADRVFDLDDVRPKKVKMWRIIGTGVDLSLEPQEMIAWLFTHHSDEMYELFPPEPIYHKERAEKGWYVFGTTHDSHQHRGKKWFREAQKKVRSDAEKRAYTFVKRNIAELRQA